MNAKIVIEVPEILKDMVKPIEMVIARIDARVRDARGGQAVDYGAVEREVLDGLAAVARGAHGLMLGALEVNAPRVRIEGKTYSRVGREVGTYYTMSGPVAVERALYRQDGCRNSKTVDAISLRTGAIGGGWLPETATAMAHLLQQGTSREGHTTARRFGQLPYARASFERVPHELAEQYLPQQADIEDELIQELEIPKETRSISLALDRVSLPMEEPRKRPVGRPRKDAPKRPVSRLFHMAYCATLTLHDAEGDGLHTIRYACMPNGDAALMCEGMAADLGRLLARRPGLKVALLGDGAPENWNLLGCVSELGIKPFELIDFWHVIEKLHAAAIVIHGTEQATSVTAQWKLMLRNSANAPNKILAALENSGREQLNDKCPVHEAITYLRNNGQRMGYTAARRAGLPIGSGTVEATCKTLVGVRMKRCGSRWKETTGDHVLQLRALALSDRFEAAMNTLFTQRRMAVRRAA